MANSENRHDSGDETRQDQGLDPAIKWALFIGVTAWGIHSLAKDLAQAGEKTEPGQRAKEPSPIKVIFWQVMITITILILLFFFFVKILPVIGPVF